MFNRHSLTGRIVITKTIGFIVGGLVFFLLPALGAEFSLEFGLGLWLMYMLMAVMIGFMGTFTTHPLVKVSLPFWIRGGAIGFSFHLLLVLLAYGEVQSLMTLDAFSWTGLTSPFWILIDGTALGVIIGWLATRFAGEGPLPLR